ncbi:biopolymer transporter [Novimethylophilus kurashikiensis]|uniref:Biopolymer transporter n=1 Tax=Novimethylophilus kurashikiensis TaxID=1825523 RepID=A0A2R5FAY8_9PROT|nr:YdcF family protein [Novimethylophilus kurashikiensis]GBG14063.1 biopolymer transporter [Novimethylophilus kurashikiensis]
MSYLTIKFVSAFLLPPLSFLLIAIVGLVLVRRLPIAGWRVVAVGIALLWLFSLPVVGNAMLMWLERDSRPAVVVPASAQAIVVLGGGVYLDAPEYPGGTVGRDTPERLRYAARLYRQSRLPILVTGGDAGERGVSEGSLMKRTLEEDFGVPVKWVESTSTDTLQNVAFSKRILDAAHIKTIVLLTHAWHMPRSKQLFEQAGFQVIPAAIGFHSLKHLDITDFLPNSDGLHASRLFFHEAIGMIWSRLHQA